MTVLWIILGIIWYIIIGAFVIAIANKVFDDDPTFDDPIENSFMVIFWPLIIIMLFILWALRGIGKLTEGAYKFIKRRK